MTWLSTLNVNAKRVTMDSFVTDLTRYRVYLVYTYIMFTLVHKVMCTAKPQGRFFFIKICPISAIAVGFNMVVNFSYNELLSKFQPEMTQSIPEGIISKIYYLKMRRTTLKIFSEKLNQIWHKAILCERNSSFLPLILVL